LHALAADNWTGWETNEATELLHVLKLG